VLGFGGPCGDVPHGRLPFFAANNALCSMSVYFGTPGPSPLVRYRRTS